MKRFNAWCLGLATFSAALLGGCANVGGDAVQTEIYDLGPIPQRQLAPQVPLASIEVRSPSWLGRSVMQYRLEYEQPAQRRAYANSRWVSPPAEMVERYLAQAFAQERTASLAGEGANCRLRIELDEFLQSFIAPGRSESQIIGRAELLAARGEVSLATHLISVRVPTPSADAAGGVGAHRSATAALADDLSNWLSELVKQSTSEGFRCR